MRRRYELMVILHAEAEEAAARALVDRIGRALGDAGSVDKVDVWGRKRLAYEIAHQSEGFYVIVEFSADPAAIKELDRMLSFADQVMRFKVVARAAA